MASRRGTAIAAPAAATITPAPITLMEFLRDNVMASSYNIPRNVYIFLGMLLGKRNLPTL